MKVPKTPTNFFDRFPEFKVWAKFHSKFSENFLENILGHGLMDSLFWFFSVPGTLIAIQSKTPVRFIQPNMANNSAETPNFVEVKDLANVHNIVFDENDSGVDQSSSDHKLRKRIKLTTTGRILQDTLEVFRESSGRRDVFQSEIGELYKKEILHAQQFREESLRIKNRKLDLLEKFLDFRNETKDSETWKLTKYVYCDFFFFE